MQKSSAEMSALRRNTLYENSGVEWRLSDAPNIQIPVSIEKYERVCQIGRGTYGSVDKAKSPSKRFVALKRLLLEKEHPESGFPITALREIKILSSIDHPNIVQLLDVVTSSADETHPKEVFLVFEYLDHDLSGLIGNPSVKFEEQHIKHYISGLFEALYFLHQKCHVLHRDVKSSNIFVGRDGRVKLGDFGLARLAHLPLPHDAQSKGAAYTRTVVTLWYRAPELLFGETHYDAAVDVWAAGCVLAELFLGRPLFQGASDAEQIDLICALAGSPAADNYPEALERFEVTSRKSYVRDFGKLRGIRKKSPTAYDLLQKILVLDPKKRVNTVEALDHDFFHSGVKPAPLSLKNTESSHEFESQRRHKERRKRTYKEKNAAEKESPVSFHSAELKRLKENLAKNEKGDGLFNSDGEDNSTEISSSDDERVVSGSEAGEILELDD